tara:strand:+ start:1289 stop:1969 length:681 start_codon:yes stop_codon:yes gene_type:complete
MSDGWIKLHRGMLEWEWYGDISTKTLFLHLLLTANHKPMRWRGMTIERGQKLTSRAKLQRETGLSQKQIRTSLLRLKRTNELAIEGAKKGSLITLCEYDTYQGTKQPKGQPKGQEEGQERANEGPSNEQEGKERKAKPSSLTDVVDFCLEIDLTQTDAEATWAKWVGNGFKNGKASMSCWKSTLRSWKLNGYLPSQKGKQFTRSHNGKKPEIDYDEIHRRKNRDHE